MIFALSSASSCFQKKEKGQYSKKMIDFNIGINLTGFLKVYILRAVTICALSKALSKALS